MTDVVIAVDAGGTKLLGALLDATGASHARREVPTPRRDSRCDPGLTAFAGLLEELDRRADDEGLAIRAVGIGFPEYVRADRLTSDEVFDWREQPADLVAARWPNRPVVVEADVRCAAHGEAHRRPDADTVLYVSWGTGLSSTLVVTGRCLPGRRGEALALGEWPVHPAVRPEPTTVERYASGRALGERYEAATGRPATGRDVVERAPNGDPIAADIVESAARAVAYAMHGAVALLDPDLIVLGGGVGSGGGPLPSRVAELLPTLLTRPDPPPVETARLGSDAGLVGAGQLAWDRVAG